MNGQQTGKLKSRLDYDGYPVGATVQRTPTSLEIEIDQRRSDPANVAKLEASMEHLTDGDELSLAFASHVAPDIKKASVAMLKAAYLKAFRHLGYRYILWDFLNPIRRAIETCEVDEIALNKIILKVAPDQLPGEIMVVKRPEVGGLAVPLNFSKHRQTYIVILPNDGRTHENWRDLAIGDQLQIGSIPDSFFPWKTNNEL